MGAAMRVHYRRPRRAKESDVTVYDVKDADGRVFAFEIENSSLGRRGVCKVLARIPGCRLARRPRFLSWLREAEFCQFEMDGIPFVVDEPFGDNSRYWIGPRPPRCVPQIVAVRQAFVEKSVPSPWVRGTIVVLFLALLSAIVWELR
jgi:hypothetical protein